MLSAIVVNREHVPSGRMEPETLAGFVAAAEKLGREVGDPERFLKNEQEAVFARFHDG